MTGGVPLVHTTRVGPILANVRGKFGQVSPKIYESAGTTSDIIYAVFSIWFIQSCLYQT